MGHAGAIDSNTSQLGSNSGRSAAGKPTGEAPMSTEAAVSNAENSAQPESEQEASQEAISANMKTTQKSKAPAVNPEVLKVTPKT
jgi:hypothetical protein